MIQEGTLLAGKYRVERQLGAGGMGYVVSAIHEQLDQRVAVKLLIPELCENKDAVVRFLREARAAVRIQSEHVARVLDVGELESGGPYMVMEFLSGRDLARELDDKEQVEARDAVDYILQACEAVAEAHSIGVIHRDLKPANLFLTRRPDGTPLVKVLDFGISKATTPDSGAQESLTAPQSLLGSPAYMSPEQVKRPKTVDTRTDIWSLGTILYELLTGEPPFQGDTPLSVLASVVSDPTPRIRDRRPDLSTDFQNIIAKCLEKDPDARYQTVADFARALAPHAPSTSLPSVSRISGILRASARPEGAGSTTLRSESGAPPPIGEADTEMTEGGEALSTSRHEKRTQTDWAASHSIMERSRRRTRVVVAALAAAAAAGVAAFMRTPGRVASAPDPVSPRPEATAAAAESVHPAAGPVVTPVPSAITAALHAPDGGEPKLAPARVKPKGQKPGAPPATVAGRPKPPAATPPPPERPPSEDPLEGRR